MCDATTEIPLDDSSEIQKYWNQALEFGTTFALFRLLWVRISLVFLGTSVVRCC